jgi:hypothetical protein
VPHTIASLHLPQEVYQYVTSKKRADIPALTVPKPGPTGPVAAELLRALGFARAVAGAEEGDDERVGTKAPKTIIEAYKETYGTFLRYCNVANPDSIVPVWARLVANCHKSEQHTVLTQVFQKVCMLRGLSTKLYAPVVTTTLKQMVVAFQFTGHGVDDLMSGCQQFLVSYAGNAHYYNAVAATDVGNLLSHGEQNASQLDYRTIREKEKLKFPRDISEVCITSTRFAVLSQCLFQGAGLPHPFVEAMWTMVTGFQNAAPFITEHFHALTRYPSIASLYHAHIIWAIQVSMHDYMQLVASSAVDCITGA